MAPKSLGLWMLCLWIQEAVDAEEVCGNYTGIQGENIVLRCCYHGEVFDPTMFRVQWQIKDNDECLVEAHLPEQNNPPQCEHFKNRTELKDYLDLRLRNIGQEHAGKYLCILQRKKGEQFQFHFKGLVKLDVAAKYLPPVITGPSKYGEDMIFTCNSSNGSPEPTVYWINQTDNSHLSPNGTIKIKQRNGTFSVSSTLIIKATSNIKLECIIKNEQLNESLNATYIFDSSTSSRNSSNNQHQTSMIAISILATGIMIIMIILLICYQRKCSLHRAYAEAPIGVEMS
ncbi:ICOS ligand [Eublepharis macularius]|uniref:ICOS ligand n=1 Tax=Eublepharis macularius TaxID=481883 RepID=A0AA97KT49_EUBMA|nr:ICOS ligand [Eublepharis macularius]